MQSIHQVDMKNVVKWASDFFPYFKTLYTNSVLETVCKGMLHYISFFNWRYENCLGTFLESPHQVDMKNIVKCYKHFFGYFNALKTHGVGTLVEYVFWKLTPWDLSPKSNCWFLKSGKITIDACSQTINLCSTLDPDWPGEVLRNFDLVGSNHLWDFFYFETDSELNISLGVIYFLRNVFENHF